MKILFVSPWYPDPPDNGAKLRISNLLSTLCSRHRVTLIAAHDPAVSPPSVHEPFSLCEKVIPVPWLPRPVRGVRRILSFLWPEPAWVFVTPLRNVSEAIVQEIRAGNHDLVVTYELSTLGYLPAYGQIPVILDDVELGGYLRDTEGTSFAVRTRLRLFAWKLQRALRLTLPRLAGCTVPSSTEYERVRRIVPQVPPIEIIPNCIDGARYEEISASSRPETLIFTGALTFGANHEAVAFFLREIYPHIKHELPGVQLCITGRHDGVALPLVEQDPSVKLAGFVDDVRPLIANSRVSIVPLLTGGGTRFKILEAMALGTPVVSTTKGAEGLGAQPNEHLLIADQPQEFAQAVVQLCQNQALHARLSTAGRRFVAENYTWQALAPRYLVWIESIALKNKPTRSEGK